MVKTNHLILAVLVIIAALGTYKVFFDNPATSLEKAYAGGGGASDGEIIAVPVQTNNNEEYLWLLKKQETVRNKKKTPPEWHVVVYSMDGGRSLKVQAARNINWDFYMAGYNMSPQRELTPDKMRENAEKGEEEKK